MLSNSGVVQEELGIETDEDVGCNLADYGGLGAKPLKSVG